MDLIEPEHHLTFGPFRLDTMHGRLWRGAQLTTLRPRSLALLRYLLEHPGRLVTKAELRQHVWAGAHVTDTVLRVCVQEIRAALGAAHGTRAVWAGAWGGAAPGASASRGGRVVYGRPTWGADRDLTRRVRP
jgi:hypothetical protein